MTKLDKVLSALIKSKIIPVDVLVAKDIDVEDHTIVLKNKVHLQVPVYSGTVMVWKENNDGTFQMLYSHTNTVNVINSLARYV